MSGFVQFITGDSGKVITWAEKTGEWSGVYGSAATKTKTYIGKVMNYFNKLKVAEIKIETGNLNLEDEIYIIGPTTGVCIDTVKEIRVELKNTDTAKKGDYCSIPVSEPVRRSDKVYRIHSDS